jgi:isopenicillin-N N-acyltransferase like protein
MDAIPVVDLVGGPSERGRSHGTQLRDEIRNFYNDWTSQWRYQSESQEAGVSERDLLEYAVAHVPASRLYAPELVEEIEGIAEGSGLSFEQVFALNCFDEVACHGPSLISAGLHGCTAFAATGRATSDGRTYVGQGWDMPPYYPPYLFRHRGDDLPTLLVLSHPGILAGTGMNEKGLCLVWNTLKSRDAGVGVPAPLVIRRGLAAEELAEMIGRILSSPRANGMNFVVGDTVQAMNVELSATRYHVTYSRGVLSHANHHEAPDLLAAGVEMEFPIAVPDSLLRTGRMRELLELQFGSLEAKTLQDVMRDHANAPGSICRHDNTRGFETRSAVVYNPAEGIVWASNGNPCTKPFVEYTVTGES